jgi:hypothetical protein
MTAADSLVHRLMPLSAKTDIAVAVAAVAVTRTAIVSGPHLWRGQPSATVLYSAAGTTGRRPDLIFRWVTVLGPVARHVRFRPGLPRPTLLGAENLVLTALGGTAAAVGDASRSGRADISAFEERAWQAAARIALRYRPAAVRVVVRNQAGAGRQAAVGPRRASRRPPVRARHPCMRERVTAIGGRLDAAVCPGGGFQAVKLSARDRAQLVVIANETGLVRPDTG